MHLTSSIFTKHIMCLQIVYISTYLEGVSIVLPAFVRQTGPIAFAKQKLNKQVNE